MDIPSYYLDIPLSSAAVLLFKGGIGFIASYIKLH